MKQLCISLVLFLALLPQLSRADDSKPMTNQDVVDMTRSKMSESIILMTIRGAKPAFDSSSAALIKLKSAGVSDSIIETMIAAKSGQPTTAGSTTFTVPNARLPVFGNANPEEVILIDGEHQAPMRYLVPRNRTAMRAFGMGGTASYAVLAGDLAALRVKNAQPSFLVAVPSNAQAESYCTLAHLAVRKNGSREILIGGGYYSYSTGITLDRVMPTTSEKVADQSKAPKDFTIYRVSVTKTLESGEYAFVLYNSQVKVMGFFASGQDSYFDFGIDG